MRGGGGNIINLDIESKKDSKNITRNIMWLDFGFNHGRTLFYRPSDLDFIMAEQIDLISHTKMNLFILGLDYDKMIEAGKVENDNFEVAIGGILYGSKSSWERFNILMQESLHHFLDSNILCDDQALQAWLISKYPQDFNLLRIDLWFSAIFYFMPESRRKNVLVTWNSSLQKSFKQEKVIDAILKEKEIFNAPSKAKRLYRKLERSIKRRMKNIRILFRNIIRI
ncbi:hypothetical protein DCO58_02460 [Helicobacter saguini]|uniref:Uncharacterized protein n=1 Tax=Helicobacter saguini TaxID=1548018 RepID=A0A4U8T2Q0_9HELI|nr:WlaTC/HtrL family glycosyltransferase [Helicobacter saguini]MWV66570.1 hypothetical protein [Helicobacter saguini]TLD93624.1 hypothetical protein LS64_008315 [Helicobacter saguini]